MSQDLVSYCTISFQLLVCSQLTVYHHSALTWPGFPFLPNNWSRLRSSTPALTGANTQVFPDGLYAFQLTATLSQSGEITPTPHTAAGAQGLDRVPVPSEAANQHLASNGDGLDLLNRCFIFA